MSMIALSALLLLQNVPAPEPSDDAAADNVEMPADSPSSKVEFPVDATAPPVRDGRETDIADAVSRAADEAADAAEAALKDAFWTGGDWSVWKGKHDCTLNRENLSIAYDWRLERTTVRIFEVFETLTDGDIRPVRTAWMKGSQVRNTSLVAFRFQIRAGLTFIEGRVGGDEFLSNLATNDLIGFLTDKDVVIASYRLRGSSEGVRKLRECAVIVGKSNPSDPFTP